MNELNELVLSENNLNPAFADLVDQITDQLEAGEPVDADDHATRIPEWTAAIRTALPTNDDLVDCRRDLNRESRRERPIQLGANDANDQKPCIGRRPFLDAQISRDVFAFARQFASDDCLAPGGWLLRVRRAGSIRFERRQPIQPRGTRRDAEVREKCERIPPVAEAQDRGTRGIDRRQDEILRGQTKAMKRPPPGTSPVVLTGGNPAFLHGSQFSRRPTGRSNPCALPISVVAVAHHQTNNLIPEETLNHDRAFFFVPAPPPWWLHAHRAVGGHRHHRRLDRAFAACGTIGPRGRTPRQCTNNLKQLALAGLNYESTNGCFAPDRVSLPGPGGTQNLFVRMLPYFEQAALFNAYNNSTNTVAPSNITIPCTALAALWCPSDGTVSTRLNLSGPDPTGYYSNLGAEFGYKLPPGTWNAAQGSYGAVFGINMNITPGAMGITYDYGGVTTIAGITDGTSNTMLMSETTTVWMSPSMIQTWLLYGIWSKKDLLDAAYAPNPSRYCPNNTMATLYTFGAASSMHPGGVNVAFADGSVRFIKDTISSWPNTAAYYYGTPYNYYTATYTFSPGPPETYTGTMSFTAAAQLGVWQKLATRAGGEVVSSDSY